MTAKTTYAYTGGTLASITDALSHVTTITQATGGGRPKKIRDPNSVFTTLSWTPRNWLSSSVLATSAGNLTTSFTYDSAGNLTKTTLPDSSYLAYGYDNAHRVTSITNALSESQGITYDSAGDVTQTLWKNASGVTKRQHTATFDALGRMLTSVGGVSQTTSFSYDSNGNVQTITDPLSHIRYISSDQLNRPYRTEDAALDISSISYDSHSRPLTVTDPRGNATSFVYDGFGDTIQQNSPDSLKTIYFYDADANLTGKNELGINFSSATYDALDRLLTRTYPADSTLNVSITYDQAGHGDGIGRLTSLTDQAGSLSRSYEARGLVTSGVRAISSHNYTTGYTYESAGRLSQITYASSGWKVTYTRDSAGQVTRADATQPGHTSVNLAQNIVHLPFGPASSWLYTNAVTDTRTFDQDYRMTSVKDHGLTDIQYLGFAYDDDNNVTGITDHVTPANNQTFHYDSLSRISFASGPYGTVSSITYDSNSNILTYGGVSNTVPSGSDRMSVSNGGSILYDSVGNVTQTSTGATQTYSKANRLATTLSGGVTGVYRYDAFGQRIMSTINGSAKTNIEQYDLSGHLLTETNSGLETDYAWLDGMPLTAIDIKGVKKYSLSTDNIGTVHVGTDINRTVVWRGSYAPFGAVSPSPATVTMNLRFPGMHNDPSGYYHNGFRDYNPQDNNDRYLETDPAGLQGWTTPWSNPYVYANANPGKYTDPSGLCLEDLCIGEAIVATEAVEALSAGVAEVAEALEAGEAAEAAAQAAADREAAENAGQALRQLSRLQPPSPGAPEANPTPEPPGEQCEAPQWSSTTSKSALENAAAHWEKHAAEFPEYQNMSEYVEGANDFIENPEGTLVKIKPNSDTMFYKPSTNTFAVRASNGVPRTMFRPNSGMDYWNKQ